MHIRNHWHVTPLKWKGGVFNRYNFCTRQRCKVEEIWDVQNLADIISDLSLTDVCYLRFEDLQWSGHAHSKIRTLQDASRCCVNLPSFRSNSLTVMFRNSILTTELLNWIRAGVSRFTSLFKLFLMLILHSWIVFCQPIFICNFIYYWYRCVNCLMWLVSCNYQLDN